MTNKTTQYSLLIDLSKEKSYNFFGVIYDSSFPKEEIQENGIYYEIILKLIDPSKNCLSNKDNLKENILTLIIRSTIKECIPYIHKIGDIICINNGNYNVEKKQISLFLNGVTRIISSWTLFEGIETEEIKILQSSKLNFDFPDYAREILKKIKSWLVPYIQIKNSLIYPDDIKLNIKREHTYNNSIAQIINKYDNSNMIIYLVQDETERCQIKVFKYFNFFEVGDVIRISNYFITADKQIITNKDSNILLIPKSSNLYEEFIKKLQKSLNCLNHSFNISPLLNSNEEKHLMDNFLIKFKDSENVSQRIFKILKFKKCLYPTVFFNNKEDNIFNFTFECEDKDNKNNIIVHLCNFDGNGDGIFKNLIKENISNDGKEIQEIINEMINSNLFCKILLEEIPIRMNNEVYQIFRIVGKYEWK